MATIWIGGKPLGLGKCIGKGGEGEVYALVEHADRAVKLYWPKQRTAREAKVRALVNERLAQATSLVAFPADLAFDQGGAFAGFTMRMIPGHRPLHELYSPKSRRVHFPNADYRFLLRAAQNVARAVAGVHQTSCIIGDLNHSGVLISKDATAALIDADSFQFSKNGQVFPCLVGVPDFTPPELHGVSGASTVRTRTHDHFGLAVAIFQILAMGRHPYAGRYIGGDISMGEAISQHRFAYSLTRARETNTTPPPGAPGLKDFPPAIAQAFEAAFGPDPERRPDAARWVTLLQQAEKELSRCAVNKSHFYPTAAGGCLWCRLAKLSGVDMFPGQPGTLATTTPSSADFDLDRALAPVRTLRIPSIEQLIPRWSGTPAKSSEVRRARLALFKDRTIGVGVLLAIGFALTILPQFFILWIPFGLFGAVKLFGSKVNAQPFEAAHRIATQEVSNAEQEFLTRLGLHEISQMQIRLNRFATDYRELDSRLDARLNQERAKRKERNLDVFLDQFLIRDASISGIGPAKLATLNSYGVESAADITPANVLAVPGFGAAMTARLMAWRQSHELKFRYDPTPDTSDIQAESRIKSEFANLRAQTQNLIVKSVAELQTAVARMNTQATIPDQRLTDAQTKLAAAERDLQLLDLPVPARLRTSLAPASTSVATASTAASPASPAPSAASAPTCPQCGSPMRRRVAKRGRNAGGTFWGCSRYPTCKGTRN